MPEQFRGFIGTGAGSTTVTLDLGTEAATVHVRSRWMGGHNAIDLTLACTHEPRGSHYGVLIVTAASDGSLPPCPWALFLEYARLPPHDDAHPGSDMLVVNERFSLLLWTHPRLDYDDGTQLDPGDYDEPVENFAHSVRALRELEGPWKLAAVPQ